MDADDIEHERKIDGCCQKNKLSICLGITTTCLTIALVLIFIAFFTLYAFSEMVTEDCTHPSCVKASVELSKFIDNSLSPCDDFYGFVCGKFVKSTYENQIQNPVKAEQDKIKHILHSFITEPPSRDDPQPVKLQKEYFRSCLNVDQMDDDKDETLFRELDKIGGWPFLNRRFRWRENEFNWKRVMIKARELGLPFEWFLKIGLYDGDGYRLKLSPPAKCGSGSEEYHSMQRDILESLRKPGIDTIKDLENLKQFEQKLDALCTRMRDVPFTLKMIDSLHLDSNEGDPEFFNAITGLEFKWKPTTKVAYNSTFIYSLNHILKGTPKKVQASYIVWKIIEYFAPYLSQPIRERYEEYLNEVTGEDTSRFQFCLEDTKTKFEFVSEITYLQNHVDSSMQEFGAELVASIKDELISRIENMQWKSNDTKQSYLDFYDNLEEIIGGTEEMFADDYLDKYLHVGQLVFYTDNIIQMLIDWSQSVFSSQMNMIGEHSTTTLGPAYITRNELFVTLDEDEEQFIVAPSAFNGFLYNSDLPGYFNYAGLGTIIGLELVKGLHMFETPNSFNGFEINKKCFIKKLKNAEHHLNTSLVLHENYDSLVSQDLVYRAYQKVLEKDESMAILNLPYSPKQLFWIKWSMNWCYHALPEEDSPPDTELIFKYRILEAVKNSPFFAEDFDCPPDAPMNPKDKCPLF